MTETLEAHSADGAVSSKTGNDLNKIERAASSSLSEKRSTAMLKELDAMDHELADGEDINVKVDMKLVDLHYIVRKDRSADNLEYDVIISKHLRHTAKMLEYVGNRERMSTCFAHHSSPSFGTESLHIRLQQNVRVLLQITNSLRLKTRRTKLLRSSQYSS